MFTFFYNSPSPSTYNGSYMQNLRTVIVTADIHGGFGSELRLAADPSP